MFTHPIQYVSHRLAYLPAYFRVLLQERGYPLVGVEVFVMPTTLIRGMYCYKVTLK